VEIRRKLAMPYSEVRVIVSPPFDSPGAIDVVTSSAAAVIASLEVEI
jgi:hypothetical protein